MRFSSFSLVNKNNCSALSCIFIFFLILKKQVKLYFYFFVQGWKRASAAETSWSTCSHLAQATEVIALRTGYRLSHGGLDTDYRMADRTQIIARRRTGYGPFFDQIRIRPTKHPKPTNYNCTFSFGFV